MIWQRASLLAGVLTTAVLFGAASGDIPSQAAQQPEQKPKVDLYGDPLPPGATARLGTVRYRSEEVSLGFLPDSRTLVSAPRFSFTGPHPLQFWDALSGQLKQEILIENVHTVRGAAMSKDGKLIALVVQLGLKDDGSMLGEVQIWDLALGKVVQRFPRGSEDIDLCPMAFSPDGKRLFSIADRQVMHIEDIDSGKEILRQRFPKDVQFSYTIAVSSDGSTVAVADPVYLWKWQSGHQPIELRTPVRPNSPARLAFSPDGKWLIECGMFKPAPPRIWDVATGKVVDPPRPLPKDSYITSISYTPDGKKLIASCTREEKTAIELWDAATWQFEQRLDGFVAGQPFVSPDGRFLSGNATPIRLWDLTAGKKLSPSDEAHTYDVDRVANFGDLVATVSSTKGEIRLWDAISGKHKLKIHPADKFSYVALSPDGTMVVSASQIGTLSLWDAATGNLKSKLAGAGRTDGGSSAVAFMPDGKFVLSWYDAWRLRKWDVATDKVVLEHLIAEPTQLRKNEPETRGGFSADGKSFIMIGLPDLRVINVETGKERYRLPFPERSWGNLTFSLDNRLMLVSTPKAKGHLVEVWELASRKVRMKMLVPGFSPPPLAISPDGKTIAVGATELPASIRLWDATNGRELPPLSGFRGRPLSLAFTSDSKRLISGLEDTTALVWDLSGRRSS